MAIIDIMAEPQAEEKAKSEQRQRPLTKTQLRQNAKRPATQRQPQAQQPPEDGEVVDFYPDVHEAVEDILFDISREPLLRDPRFDHE